MSKGIIYCTYFDQNYLLKGLAMYHSLLRFEPTARLWVLPMDRYTAKILKKMKLQNLYLVKPKDFEDRKLLKAKKNRSKVEYMLTCTPSLPLYLFKKIRAAKNVVYLDADLYFYSTLRSVFREFANGSIYTVEHRYPLNQKNREKKTGRFNVGFQIFSRKKESMECLKRWRKQCLDWCYWKYEDGKLGDQLYLNEWPDLYKSLIISKNLGLDAAPWNIKQYKVSKRDSTVFINHDKLICYHFHQFEILGFNKFNLAYGYSFTQEIINLIYKPYKDEINREAMFVKEMDPSFRIGVSGIKLKSQIMGVMARFLGPLYWWSIGYLLGGKGHGIGEVFKRSKNKD